MEKLIFLATLKEKLTELNIPEATIQKHTKIFEDCFVGKTAAEIDAVIEGAGGIDGIIKSVYNLENTKAKKIAVTESAPVEEIIEQNEETKEISTISEVDNIDEHIKEAEDITTELEKTAINTVVSKNNTDTEFADDISEYDFEVLFAEKLSKPEKWVKNLKEKLNRDTYIKTKPLAIAANVLLYILSALLFPLLIVSAIFVALLFVAVLAAGICFALVPIGYGVYMSFKTTPIAQYEIGLGLIVLGLTMISSILLYNYNKRLVPFLFKKITEWFNICIRITKLYFNTDKKEENNI